jgi:hypothetical protein
VDHKPSEKVFNAHNSQYRKHQTGLRYFNFTAMKIMSFDDETDCECTPAIIPEAVSADTASAAVDQEAAFVESIGKMIQDLFCSDNASVNAALDALNEDLMKDTKKGENIQVVGGCFALVHLVQKYIDTAIANFYVGAHQVTDGHLDCLDRYTYLTILNKTLSVITNLTLCHDKSIVGITAIGGVEAAIKVLNSFPKCLALQTHACMLLAHLTCSNVTGEKKAIESGGIEVLLAAVTTHLGSASLCENACQALFHITSGSKENTGLFIRLGGATAVAKVRTEWSDDDAVQSWVRKLSSLIASEMRAWADEE